MKLDCYGCGFEMIWGGDESVHDEFEDVEMIESNFSCPVCKATALVYHSHTKNKDDFNGD